MQTDVLDRDDLPEDVADPPKRAPGRPVGSKTRSGFGKKVVQTRQEFVTDASGNVVSDIGAADDDEEGLPPIFDSKLITQNKITKIRVSRSVPDEGFLGYMSDLENATESAIKDQWGGGTYRLDGVNDSGQIQKTTSRKIAGDPKFESIAAEISWKRSRGIPLTPATVNGEKAMSTADILIMFKQMEAEKAKDIEERDDRNRRLREETEKQRRIDEEATRARLAELDRQRRQEEREHQERMRKSDQDAEDRRRKEDDDRERPRKLDDEER